MVLRVVLVSVLELVLSLLLAWLLGGLLLWGLGSDPAAAFTSEVAHLLFVFMDVGIVVWMLMLIVGAVRRRGLGWGVGGTILAALLAVVVNLVVVSIIAIAQGGADIFAIAIGVEAGLVFLVAAVVAVVVARRIVPAPATTR